MQSMHIQKEKRHSKSKLAAACIVVTLLIALASAVVYSLVQCSQLKTQNSQLEFRLKKLENFIETKIRESVSDVDISETELEKLSRKRRDTTDQLANLSLHELLSLRGRAGKDGQNGLNGRDGRDGEDGQDGRDGRDGEDGEDGQNGLNGRDGRDGQNGRDGEDGEDGVDGVDGRDGRDGDDGKDGQDCDCSPLLSTSTAVSTISNSLVEQLSNITNSVRELQSRVLHSNQSSITNRAQLGSSYIRWGHTSCGNNSQLLHEGFAAGSHYNQVGGSAEYTCLPQNPEYNRWSTSDTGGWIYGAESQSSNGIFPNEASDKNVPCARCYTPNRSETIMIPAKRTCPDAWNKEFEGYLMSGYKDYKHTYNYACVDVNPEYLAGSDANTNGALFYFVQTSCASTHHCPPYKQGWELTCVVCSK